MSPIKRPFQPAFLAFVAEPLDELDEFRITPIAVARQPHDLPGRPGDRQLDRAGHAAVRVGPDGARGPGSGVSLRANSSFAGVFGESGSASGGSGLGLSVPGGVVSIVLAARGGSCRHPARAPDRFRRQARQTRANKADIIVSPLRHSPPWTCLGNGLGPIRDRAGAATIRCRKSLALSSHEQVVVRSASRQQPLLGRRVRLDRAVVQDVADREPRSASARATSRQRWQSSGSRSAHIKQTRCRAASDQQSVEADAKLRLLSPSPRSRRRPRDRDRVARPAAERVAERQ